jgi:tetratricopeptide (TPR) repeat protein
MATLPRTAEEIDALWDFDDPPGSERRFRELLERVTAERAEADFPVGAEISTQLARALGLQQRYAEANQTLNPVEPLLPPGASRLRARYLLERGRVLNSSAQPDRARPLFLDALRIAQQAGEDYYAVDAAHMLAIVSSGEEQLDWNRRGLAMAAGSDDPRARGWTGSLYNNLGWAHHERGELAEALHCFEEALRARLEVGDARRIRIARWCVARGLRSLGRVEEALRMQQDLRAALERIGEHDPHVTEEIAACLTALGRAGEARS